jgi:hypothetical protein
MDAEQWRQAEGRECALCGQPIQRDDDVLIGQLGELPEAWQDEVVHAACWEVADTF